MDESLLQTKLYVPNIPQGVVHRTSLYKRLDLICEKKLCLISTPAGYGKTTLVVSWAKQRGQPLAWISLDEGDNSFSRFFAYLISAVRRVTAGFGAGLFERLTSAQGILQELFLVHLVNELDRVDQDCVIVLDDYHTIHHREIHEAIEYLLDNLPAQIHFVISSRAEPPFSTANLRARGQLLEIRYSDLCFSEGDAFQYLNQTMGLALAPDQVEELVDYTEGWIVGLHLAAIALASTDKTAAFLTKLNSAHRYITDYLLDEILKLQPPLVQDFLLQTAVMDRFTAELCDAALGIQNSHELIARVERSNLFIVQLDMQQEWYRYHHLFSELLLARLRKNHPELIRGLWQRASLWFERQELLEDAVEYAMQAQDYRRAAVLIESFSRKAIWTGSVTKLLSWLEVLPNEIFHEFPILWITHLWSHINLAHFSNVADELGGQRHETITEHIKDEETKQHFRISLATVQALIAINWRYDLPAGLQYAETGLRSLDERDESSLQGPLIYGKACMLMGDLVKARGLLERCASVVEKTRGPFIRMIITHHRSELAFFHGDLREQEALLKEAYQVGIEHHLDDTSAFFRICIDLGRLHYERDNLAAAHQFLTTGVQGAARYLIAYDVLDGYCAIFALACRERNLDAAEQAIAGVEYLAKNSGFSQAILNRAEAMRARLAISIGDWHLVHQWLEKMAIRTRPDFMFHERYEAHTAVQALVAVKDLTLAKRLAESLLHAAEKGQMWMEAAHCQARLAAILYQQGNLQVALAILRPAVGFALSQGCVQTMMDAGDLLPDLLGRLSDDLRLEAGQEAISLYARKLIESRETVSRAVWFSWPGVNLSEPLTERELEVLQSLVKGHSNQEIAAVMVVSLSTVKFHLKNIYLKLGVHTRTQAIARAGELRLI